MIDRRWFFTAASLAQMSLICIALAACADEPTVADKSADKVITLSPGDDLQSAVEKAPPGSKFLLEPGLYRQQRIRPKDGQEITGKPGAIISGAMPLLDWRSAEEADLWAAGGLPPQLRPSGMCKKGGKLCRFREDLFVDGKFYKRVASKEELGPGKWLYLDGMAYLAENPAGRNIELSVAPVAISGRAKNVVLRNLVVEKFATAAQFGAIDARHGDGWRVIDVTARWNHGVGIYMGSNMHIIGGSVVNNGQLGIGGRSDNGVVDGVRIAYNNYAGFSAGWEAGGTKFVRSDNLIIRNTCVHHNNGPGLWTDIDNVNIVYEGNKVFQNAGDGIKHEISYKAVIRNNQVAENGYAFNSWLWGSQILVQNSQDVEVYDNTVVVGANGGNGISIINQERGSGTLGPYVARNNRIEGNTILHLGQRGNSGIVVDFDQQEFWRNNSNTFDGNEYVGVGAKRHFWMLRDGARTWAFIRDNGMEADGTLDPTRRAWNKITCND